MDTISMNIQKLTNVIGGNFTPNLSPDGEKIVFASFRKGETLLYLSDTSFFVEKPVVEMLREEEPENVLSEDLYLPFKFKEKSAKYSFKASTDLIFPIFFYSSLDGFFASIYYQASEYLGNHKLQAMLNYGSKEDIVDYDFAYIYSGFRPNFIFGGSGENYYRDIELKERAVQHAQYAGMELSLIHI